MDVTEPPTRRYRSALREQQAERTRVLIAEAARSRFLEAGWAGTSVRSVAAAAGVSEATVYAVYGSKAGLADRWSTPPTRRPTSSGCSTSCSGRRVIPPAQLAAYVGFDRRLFEHGGDVLRVIMEGRRQEPDLAAAYTEGRSRGERGRRRLFASWPASAWRPGIGRAACPRRLRRAVLDRDYDIATREGGWSPARVERWWCETLVGLLLA